MQIVALGFIIWAIHEAVKSSVVEHEELTLEEELEILRLEKEEESLRLERELLRKDIAEMKEVASNLRIGGAHNVQRSDDARELPSESWLQ